MGPLYRRAGHVLVPGYVTILRWDHTNATCRIRSGGQHGAVTRWWVSARLCVRAHGRLTLGGSTDHPLDIEP